MIEEIFYKIDTFYKKFHPSIQKNLLEGGTKRKPGRKNVMDITEILTIMVHYHFSGCKNFKVYYNSLLNAKANNYFYRYVSYNRFIEIRMLFAHELKIVLDYFISNKCSGISYIDSTSIKVCHEKRSKRNKTFKGYARTSKTIMGFFHGFKLHIVINHKGELVSYYLSAATAHDLNEKVINSLTKNVRGKLYGDRGYISQPIFKKLWSKGIYLITRVRKNMKNKLLLWEDKVLLRYRLIIESSFNLLKNRIEVEHTRYRSRNYLVSNILSALIAYTFYPNKPSIDSHFIRLDSAMTAF